MSFIFSFFINQLKPNKWSSYLSIFVCCVAQLNYADISYDIQSQNRKKKKTNVKYVYKNNQARLTHLTRILGNVMRFDTHLLLSTRQRTYVRVYLKKITNISPEQTNCLCRIFFHFLWVACVFYFSFSVRGYRKYA